MTDSPHQAIADMIDNAEPYDADAMAGGGPPQPPDDGGDGDGGPSQFGKPDPAVVQACALLDQNDTDNGRRLLNHFGDRWLSVREIGTHIWHGTHWDPDGGDEAMQRMAQETARRIKLECDHIVMSPADARMVAEAARIRADDSAEQTEEVKALLGRADAAEKRNGKRRGARHGFAVSSGNRNRTMSMISQALPHRSCAPADLDCDPMLFNLANGTLRFSKFFEEIVDLECPDPEATRFIRRVNASCELLPHTRDHRIAKIARVAFDPDARAPVFHQWFEKFQPDESLREFLQTAVGRAMLGGASTQALIFLYGDGANGKSVFMEVISQLLGDYGGRLKPESISGALEGRGDQATPDFARLAGKRFVAIAELGRNVPLREGLVKTMTGGEPMPVRHLQKGFFDLMPEFIPFMSGNDLPEIGGLDLGIWRRMRFVHWPVTVAEADQRSLKDVVGEMMAEAPGIINWAVEGALRFLREGLKAPPAVISMTQAHRDDLDPVGAFLTACVRDARGQEVAARTMYEAFTNYCDANAIRPWKETMFGRALKKKGLTREDKRIRKWINVELFDVPPPRSPFGSLGP